MIPAAFDFVRPQSLEEAVGLLEHHGDKAKLLAGGHSLLPAMKLRLAQPGVLIDIGRLPGMSDIREAGGKLVLGALATHHAIETSMLLRQKCPLLPEVAADIGDVQVRNLGTLGGSLAHADPAADWPAAMLALEAEIEIVGRSGCRTIAADEFFVDLYQTALEPAEIVRSIRVPITAATVAYEKSAQRASGFALTATAVWLRAEDRSVRVGVTGLAAKPFRARRVEQLLRGHPLNAETAARAAAEVSAGQEPLGDIHASAEFRAHLARVNTRRALERAAARA
jgi:carbon-monoxide dehydrogenase medium subunit